MNDLERYFVNNRGRLIHKWNHFFEVYDRHLSRFRGTEVHLLEIGVGEGGSLQMWKAYFGRQAHIYGVDINPECRKLEEDQIRIVIGDQADKNFLRHLVDEIPRMDVLQDDGGHRMEQQINTFEVLFPHLDREGVYICEDLHTSYWREFGGGWRKRGSFIEHSKGLIDHLHAWHSRGPRSFTISDLTHSIHSLHFYSGILVVEKRPMQRPFHTKSGVPSFKRETPAGQSIIRKSLRWARRAIGS